MITDRDVVDLLSAFLVGEEKRVEAVAVLLVEDGFDAETMRVLAAWEQVELKWSRPRTKIPDGGRASARAWRWLVSGLDIDADELAAAAGVAPDTARAKAAMLLANRLAFPDGSITKIARASLQQHARRALGVKAPKQQPKSTSPGDDQGGN